MGKVILSMRIFERTPVLITVEYIIPSISYAFPLAEILRNLRTLGYASPPKIHVIPQVAIELR